MFLGYSKTLIFTSFLLFAGIALSEPTPAQILDKIRVAQAAKQKAGDTFIPAKPVLKPVPFSQTEAYLKINSSLVDAKWSKELKQHKPLIDQMLQQEKALKDTHYVFYHSQRAPFRIVHDITKEIYQIFSLSPSLKEFNFLRTWYDSADTINVTKFLDMYEHMLSTGWNHDYSDRMICVNLSLFGNSNRDWECSFFYFVNNQNIFSHSTGDMIYKLFNQFDFDKKYVDQLIKLSNMIKTNEGLLYQIFIPKEKVDQYIYLSSVGTEAWNKLILDSYFDHAKKRHTLISPILETYCINPYIIPEIDAIQARILLSQDLLLSPTSGVKIMRYSTASKTIEQEYQKKLEDIMNSIMLHWLNKKTIKKQIMHNVIIKSMPIINLLKDFQM